MSLKNGFNASSVRDYTKRAVVILMSGFTFAAGTGFSTEAQAQNPLSVFVDTFAAEFQAGMSGASGGGQWRNGSVPDVEQAQRENARSPWQNNAQYQLELRQLRLQASPALKNADIYYSNAKAACLTNWTSSLTYLRNYKPTDSAGRAHKLSMHNQAVTTFSTCNESANVARESTYNSYAQYFLALESRWAQSHGAQLQQAQQQQQQQAAAQQQQDGQSAQQRKQMCQQVETQAMNAAITANDPSKMLPDSHLCYTMGIIPRPNR